MLGEKAFARKIKIFLNGGILNYNYYRLLFAFDDWHDGKPKSPIFH